MALTATRRQARGRYVSDQNIAAMRRAAVGLLCVMAIMAFVALAVAASLLIYGYRHDGVVYRGTEAAGVDLGGKTQAESATLLDQRLSAYAQQPLQFTANGKSIEVTPAQLGVTFDAQAMALSAYDFGRDDNLWIDSRHWLDAMSGGHVIPVVVNVDPQQFSAFFQQHAAEFTVAPRDAAITRADDGSTTIDPGSPGVAIDLSATLEALQQRANTLSTKPVEIATVSVPPTTDDADLRAALDQTNQLAGHALDLTLDGTTWQLSSQQLFDMLLVDTSGEQVAVSIDRQQLRGAIASLEHDAFAPGVNAGIANNGGKFAATPAAPGHKLDIDASTDAALNALANGQSRVALATTPVAPQVTDADAQAALAAAQKLTASDVTLTWDSGSAVVPAAELAKAVTFDVNPARNPDIAVSFDENALQQAFAPIADQVKVAAKDADLRWIDGKVQVKTPEQNGRELDPQATADAVRQALAGGTTNVAIVTKDTKPAVTAAMAPTIQIRDKLGEGQTYYGDSGNERYHNVELGAERVNGAMVPPGGTFSFNAAIGDVTYKSGYEQGYGIVVTNGSIETVPSVGGGICQIATTVFQAAFHAGMPVVQRSWHLYWIPRYGTPPDGMKGLDATVDPDYDLDMQFKNSTNDWIALKSTWDGANVRFELWGTNQGWQVQIDQPVITNVVPAGEEMHYEHSDALPAGTSVYVEEAEDGFDAAVHRVVKDKDGKVIDDTTLHSNYAPAQNTTLIGTG